MSVSVGGQLGAIPVLIADSNRMQAHLLTSALRRRPEFRIATCLVDVDAILEAIVSTPARVVLVSLNRSLETASQMSAMRRLHLSYPTLPTILLTEVCDREIVVTAFRAGARGIFSLADSHFRLLCRCIQRVADGQIWANTEQLNFLLEVLSETPSTRVVNARGLHILTPREEQVVALVAGSLSNRDIARQLNLSEHTVKKYMFRIFEKLGISSRVELAMYAVNNGQPREEKWAAAVRPPMADA